MTPSRDELSQSLRVSFRAIIEEADEWRPLADHILALIRAAILHKREAIAEFVRTHKVIWCSQALHLRVEEEQTDKTMEILAFAIRARPAP